MFARLCLALLGLLMAFSMMVAFFTADIPLRWEAMYTFLLSGVVTVSVGIYVLYKEWVF